MILWLWDDRKNTWPDAACHSIMNIDTMMSSQIIPYENVMHVGAWDIVGLYVLTDMITKIVEDMGHHSHCVKTTNPSLRPLNTPL